MLDSKNLSELLTRNVHPQLYARIFVMSRSGSLIAYSTPANMLQLRDQAALISMAWRENAEADNHDHDDDPNSSDINGHHRELKALTVEFGPYNLIARAIQANLILVLIGGVFPVGKKSFKLTAETLEDPVYPTDEGDLQDGIERSSALQLQRRKADTLADFIDNQARSVNMPEDTQLQKPFT